MAKTKADIYLPNLLLNHCSVHWPLSTCISLFHTSLSYCTVQIWHPCLWPLFHFLCLQVLSYFTVSLVDSANTEDYKSIEKLFLWVTIFTTSQSLKPSAFLSRCNIEKHLAVSWTAKLDWIIKTAKGQKQFPPPIHLIPNYFVFCVDFNCESPWEPILAETS